MNHAAADELGDTEAACLIVPDAANGFRAHISKQHVPAC